MAKMTLAGLAIVRPGVSHEVQYCGLFLAVMGALGNQMAILTFGQNNIVGSNARMVMSVANLAFSATGGIIGSTILRSQDAPTYGPGLYTTMGMQAASIVGTGISMAIFAKLNRNAAQTGELLKGIEGWRYTL